MGKVNTENQVWATLERVIDKLDDAEPDWGHICAK